MTMLLSDCMRRSPDRIVIGEVKDGTAHTMLKAWNTGHPGSACTVHANGALDALTRIRELALEGGAHKDFILSLIGSAINVVGSIVHVILPSGIKTRRVDEIIVIKGYDENRKKFIYQRIGSVK